MPIRIEALVNSAPDGWRTAHPHEARIENVQTGEVLAQNCNSVDVAGKSLTVVLGMGYTGPVLKATQMMVEGYPKKAGGKVDGAVFVGNEAKIEKTAGLYRLVISAVP